MGHGGVDTVGIVSVFGGGGDGLGQNDGNNEAINAEYSGHDDGDDVLHYGGGVADACVEHRDAGLPGPPGRAEVR